MATVPPSIKAAFSQADARWPGRDTGADGSIGDAAHASRASDHNPDSRGIVHAFDLTHDPGAGVDGNLTSEMAVNDPRTKYVIWNRRINSRDGRGWRPYSGSNPHTHHIHVSIHATSAAENDTAPWWGEGDDDVTEADLAKLAKWEKDTRAEVIGEVTEVIERQTNQIDRFAVWQMRQAGVPDADIKRILGKNTLPAA